MYLRKVENYDEIVMYAEKLLAADKLHEDAYVLIIDAFSKSGNHNMAKKKFTQLLKNYEEEYGEKPPKCIKSNTGNPC
jgi:DNA-binding SARP family transcriptional activator